MKTTLLSLTAVVALGATAQAQVTPIANEFFDYPSPGLLINNSGGAGWAGAWEVYSQGNELVMFDPSINPPFVGRDAVGNYLGQANGFGTARRIVDNAGHSDITDQGQFGKDGAVVWLTIRTVAYQVFGDHYGGMSLLNANLDQVLFIGSPWGTYEWGLAPEPFSATDVHTIAGSDVQTDAVIVVRVAHLPGAENVKMWVNPSVDYPTGPADLDVMMPDFRWGQIRFSSGGGGSNYFWDGLEVGKGDPAAGNLGTIYCDPNTPNTTGIPGKIAANGSAVASQNNVTLLAYDLPLNQFGIFITSQTSGFIANPGGSQGNLCVVGALGRYNRPGELKSSGTTGEFSLPLDLTDTPTPTGAVTIFSGQTWYFQTWYRDFISGQGATSNFTNGLLINFN